MLPATSPDKQRGIKPSQRLRIGDQVLGAELERFLVAVSCRPAGGSAGDSGADQAGTTISARRTWSFPHCPLAQVPHAAAAAASILIHVSGRSAWGWCSVGSLKRGSACLSPSCVARAQP